MWMDLGLGFLVGILAANGVPHFVKGVVKERYPCALGNGPLPNLLAGWAFLLAAALIFHAALPAPLPVDILCAIFAGVLAMGSFHATIGAFGRPERP